MIIFLRKIQHCSVSTPASTLNNTGVMLNSVDTSDNTGYSNQQYHPLCQFRVNSSGIVWCEAPNKYHYNICIWRKTRWIGPIFNYDMTMTASAQLLTHLLTASFLAKQPRRFFEMSFMWLWCLISESKLLTYSFKKFMVIQVE